ncbi:hypothetical protein [Ferribacterium limneticum]|uniref:hypothetical protein n=1 Tax=Ferribacterium limneticum TaxID=76259 RepID=UPI001CFBCC49|nr:hypothetical protein [Ferribacterium limneticum]UCV17730.1 hypothetical protein KI610_12980 [Ferribacterium limneticum]
MRAGTPIMLDVVNPSMQIESPGHPGLRLRGDDSPQELTLFPVGPVAADGTHRPVPVGGFGLLAMESTRHQRTRGQNHVELQASYVFS